MLDFSVALFQLNSSKYVDANLGLVQKWAFEACEAGVEMIFLPETFAAVGLKDAQVLQMGIQEAESTGPIRTWLAALARHCRLWIVAGSIPVMDPKSARCRARCIVYNSAGEEVAFYDKMHLFDADVDDGIGTYQESKRYEAGDQPVTVPTPWGVMGLSVCYDLRFPELYRALLDQGVEWLCVPSAFTRPTGAQHWEVLLRARAIENQCYVIAPAQTGVHDDLSETWGHSLVVDPQGSVVLNAGELAGWSQARLHAHEVSGTRAKMPCLQHRKSMAQ